MSKRTLEVELSTSGLDARGRPQRIPLSATDDSGSSVAIAAPLTLEPDLEGEHMLINIGPQHPATHGVLRLVLGSSMARLSSAAFRTSAICTAASRRSASTASTIRSSAGPIARTT